MRFAWIFIFIFRFFRGSSSLFLRVETGHQNIAIDGRDAYFGHFTKIHFRNRTCLTAIDIHCLKELTGAEEIDLLYSECHKDNWKVAHYTNSKHHFRLKQPVNALRLLISSRTDLSIIDAQVESCSSPNTTNMPPNCRRSAHNHRHSKVANTIRAIDSHRRLKRSTDNENGDVLFGAGRHNITEDRIVPRGTTLTIPADTDLAFAEGISLIVYGRLHVNGSEHRPVRMYPITNGKSWRGIQFIEAEPGSIITHANITGSMTGIHVDRGNSPYLEDVIVDQNDRGVVLNELGSSSFSHLTRVISTRNLQSGIEYTGKKNSEQVGNFGTSGTSVPIPIKAADRHAASVCI